MTAAAVKPGPRLRRGGSGCAAGDETAASTGLADKPSMKFTEKTSMLLPLPSVVTVSLEPLSVNATWPLSACPT
jgi:hypothetical protein